MSAAPARAALLVALALAAIGCHRSGVVRVVSGEEHTGPFIGPDAYASYATGAVAESEGRLELAAAAYAEALDLGGDALVHARLGAVLCKLGRVAEAREQLARGYDADPRAAVVFRERARCALRAEAFAEAVEASEHAVQLDPDDRESLAIRMEALTRAGRERESAALRDESVTRHGLSATGDARSVDATAVRPGGDIAPLLRDARGDLASVDEALARGDLAEASTRASRARLGRSAFAARALAFGHVVLARDIARRVLAADPSDTSARFVAAAAADLANDDADLSRALASGGNGGNGGERGREPNALARFLFAEVLARRAGAAAASAFVSATLLDQARADPLEERVRIRLRAAMAPRALAGAPAPTGETAAPR